MTDEPDHPLAGGLDEELVRRRVMARLLGDSVEALRIGDYIIEDKLGSGGMGEVYAARPVAGGERVALKTLARAVSTHLYRFKREFRALADVSHPNLVRLHELGLSEDGRSYFTMELVDGQPFVEWVREDLGRLEDAARQLLAGVQELHRLGCVHRDLKPSNVLVDGSGRVVILDFGLISELDEPERGVTRDGQLLGTPAYMAPEQALGRRAGPPADYYALGLMLFECLTGRLPRTEEGGPEPDPAAALAHAPPRLAHACAGLLEPDPARRMGGEALARAFAARQGPSAQRPERFVGRGAQLAALHACYAAAAAAPGARAEVVHLRGRSGQGKSTLLRRLRSELRERGALVFHGRCREREAVPYKGLDAVIDEISAHLHRLPSAERAPLQPRSAAALVEAFPVFADLWPDATVQPLSPRELRGVSWAALRELLELLGRPGPIALIIDDFQWADLDSVQLLHELVRPPRPPSLVAILSIRDDVDGTEAVAELDRDRLLGEPRARRIELEPLSEGEAVALIEQLAPGRSEEWVRSLALRSAGNPLFIEQMLHGDAGSGAEDLHGLVARRLATLEAPARRLVEVVAAAGGPLPRSLALELCTPAPSAAQIDALIEAGLIVEGTLAAEPELELSHDRIRELTLALLDGRPALHLAIAARLLARSPAPAQASALSRIVGQLDAGRAELDALAAPRRLAFAGLVCEAGELALRSGSYTTARRDFELARALAEPWLGGLDPARPHYALELAIWFGLARASGPTPSTADTYFAELLHAPLPATDYGRVVIERINSLIHQGRVAAGCALQLEALRRLGVSLPRRPSKLWALRRLGAGRRAYARVGADSLIELPEAAPGLERTIMEVMASAAIHWLTSSTPLWGLGLAGLHAERVLAAGFHDLTALGLAALGVSLSLTGGADEMPRLLASFARCEALRPMSASDRAHLRLGALLFGSRHRPLRELAAEVEPAHRDCHETGQHSLAAFMRSECASLHLDCGTPLDEVERLLDELHALPDTDADDNDLRSFVRALIEGPELAPVPAPVPSDSPTSAYAKLIRAIELDVLFGRFELAAASVETIAADVERVLFGAYHLIPVYAMLSVIVEAERGPSTARRPRARKRALRRHEQLLARWAADCPINFAPMAALAQAELAALADDTEAAMLGYERARKGAAAVDMRWLVGLASARLARFAGRREHTLTADAAMLAAREAYHGWGAQALVRQLDEQLAGNEDLLALVSTRSS